LASAARQLYEWAKEQGDEEVMVRYGSLGWLTPRFALQTLGTEWGRNCYRQTWVVALKNVVGRLSEGGCTYSRTDGVQKGIAAEPPIITVPDARFPSELDGLREIGAILVRVKRRVGNIEGAAAHTSETALLSTPDSSFDHIIENYRGLDCVKDGAEDLAREILSKV